MLSLYITRCPHASAQAPDEAPAGDVEAPLGFDEPEMVEAAAEGDRPGPPVTFSFRPSHSKAYHIVFDLVRKSGCCQSNCFKLWLFVRKRSDVLMLSPETDFYLFRFATKCRSDDFLYIAISVA